MGDSSLGSNNISGSGDDEKFVLIYALIKLRLLRGKCLLFVRSTERAYKLKLFLEQFSIYTCVLNAQMPVNSR